MQIKWNNVPIPEGHVIPLMLGIIAQEVIPSPLDMMAWLRYTFGIPALLAGVLLAAWSVREAGTIEVHAPTKLITTGPFAFSRNPMYLAWSLIYIGGIFLVNTRWLLLLFTFVLAYTHYRVIPQEEKALEKMFGTEYRVYCRRVRRYF